MSRGNTLSRALEAALVLFDVANASASIVSPHARYQYSSPILRKGGANETS